MPALLPPVRAVHVSGLPGLIFPRHWRREASTLWLLGPALLGIACGGNADPTPPTGPTVARVDISPAGGVVPVGGTIALQAQPFDASGVAVTGRAVTWRSDAVGVATVSNTGLVAGMSAGVAPINATVSGVSATVMVTVRDAVRIEADSVHLEGVGIVADLRVTRNGLPVVAPALTLVNEARWLAEQPVLDVAMLAQGKAVSAGPGRARVRVQVDDVEATVTLGVTLPQPRIYSVQLPGGRTHLGDGDTLSVRGYALNSPPVAALQASGFTPTTTMRDSANWHFTISSAPAACAGTPAPFTLTLAGSDGSFPTGLRRAFANELALEVGEARRLTDAEAACLRLRPEAMARHLLAYADVRLQENAAVGPEFPWPAAVTVRVTPAGTPPVNPVMEQATPTPGSPLLHAATRPSGAFGIPPECPLLNIFAAHCRTTPYVLGEVFTHYPSGRPSGPARVIAIRGNLVLAVFRADSALLAPNAVARADSALSRFAAVGIPWLQGVFGLSAPTTTSDESGQLLITLEAAPISSTSWFPDAIAGHGRWAQVTLDLADGSGFRTTGTSYGLNFSIIAHEVTHSYQYRWRWQYAGPWLGVLGTRWGVEGGAVFAQLETLREVLGIPFAANANYDAVPLSDPSGALQVGARAHGDLTAGYAPAASFLRDLMQRLVQGGMTTQAAAREVLLGVMEGWYGINDEGQSHGPGLTARVRARLGASWNPADAMLLWTMTEAADDLTSNPLYQNVSYRQAQLTTAAASLPPHALVQPGVAAAVMRLAGNSGVFELADQVGTAFRADATVSGTNSTALEWLVLRIR